jgi:putative methionine-R-sulfoxide reductase with GAF domain
MFDIQTTLNNLSDISDTKGEMFIHKNSFRTDDMKNATAESFMGKSIHKGENLKQFSQYILSSLAKEKEISQAIFFITDRINGNPVLKFLSGYAYTNPESIDQNLEFGEGFPGQVAKDGKLINITDIPEGYMSIESGLGKSSPISLIIFPIKHNDDVLAVIELASFHKFTREDELFFEQISSSVGEQLLNSITNS